jgi:ribosomal protein S18 acetylase RimI-like enzyme
MDPARRLAAAGLKARFDTAGRRPYDRPVTDVEPARGAELRQLSAADRDWVEQLIVERWGDPFVVGRGGVWKPAELPGFAVFDGGECVGLVTYELDGKVCEIVTIDALREGVGIGTTLLAAVVDAARAAGCNRVQLMTTNNNLRALAFYQKRGFRLVGLRPGAIDEERKLKPSMPAVDAQGLPIRDELHLELPLT